MFVCHNCIGEAYLSQDVHAAGNRNPCNFCGKVSASIELEDLAERIHEVIERYFVQTPSEPEGYEYLLAKEGLWEREGEQVGDLIGGIAVIEPEIGEAVHEYLSQQYDAAGKDALLEEQPYDEWAQYTDREVDTLDFSESWSSFKQSIRRHSRFFNPQAKEALDQIFHELGNQITVGGEPVIRTLLADDADSAIFRGRVASSQGDLKEILGELPKSLAAPPHKHARSGRMNADGVSVFYGALDVDTCIAEIRAPVGSHVIIGKFCPVRPIRVLDLSRLQNLYVVGSYFDPGHFEELSRARFLERLVDELSSPVLPGSENREYLPTQVVSEYLAQLNGERLDGVMFWSSQVSGRGDNMVLFNHASCVEEYALPSGSKVDVHFGIGDPDDCDSTITLWERVPKESKAKDSEPEPGLIFPSSYDPDSLGLDEDCPHDPTLRLDIESITVHYVQGVAYQCQVADVHRYRTNEKDREEF